MTRAATTPRAYDPGVPSRLSLVRASARSAADAGIGAPAGVGERCVDAQPRCLLAHERLIAMSGLFDLTRVYAVTVNGRISTELKAGRWEPVPNKIAGFLDRLDGTTRFSVSLWALPVGTSFDCVNLHRWPERYLQAAGSRDRMTVELRRDGESGSRHFAIGKSDTIEPEPSEEIRWDAHRTQIYQVEVFTAAEAVPLFLSYWQTNEVPRGYRLRALDL